MALLIKELMCFLKFLAVVALTIAYIVPVYWLLIRLGISGIAATLVSAGLLQLGVWVYRKTPLSHWLKFDDKGTA